MTDNNSQENAGAQLAIVPKTEPRKMAIPEPSANLVKKTVMDLTEFEFNRLEKLAGILSRSSQLAYAKVSKEAKLSQDDIMTMFIKGMEVGFGPMAAMDAIDLIQGQPTLSPAGQLALISASGLLEDIEVLEESDTVFHMRMTRKGRTPYEKRVTIEEYSKMTTTSWVNGQRKTVPLTEKQNWQEQRGTMLKWRCSSAVNRFLFGDILSGLKYTAEELGADVEVDDIGNMRVINLPAEAVSNQTSRPAPVATETGEHESASSSTSGSSSSATGSNWFTGEAQKTFIGWLKEKGYTPKTALELLGKSVWTEYADGRAACEAVQNAINALTDKPATPKGPQTPATGAKPKASTGSAWTDNNEAELYAWLEQSFVDSSADLLTAMEKTKWRDNYASPEAAKTAVREHIITTEGTVIAESLKYGSITGKKADGTSYQTPTMDLVTAIGDMRLFGSRDKFTGLFAELHRPGAVETYQPDNWEKGNTYELIPSVMVMWHVKEGYNVPVGLAFAGEPPAADPGPTEQEQFEAIPGIV